MFFILLCIPENGNSRNRIQGQTHSAGSDLILTVNIPTELFIALVSYQELSEAENKGEEITRKMIPILESIVRTLKSEKRKFAEFRPDSGADEMLENRLAKLDRHLNDFQNELRYRKKVLEFYKLKEAQKAFIEGD